MFESYLKPPLIFPTLTGSIVTFNSQYAGFPLKSHKIALTATQSGSGTPSPDNVRTINGYSELHTTNSSIVNSSYSTSGTVAQVPYATVTILSANSFRMVKSSSGQYPATRQPLSALSLTNGHTYKLYAYFNISSQTTKSLRFGLRNGNTFTSEVVRPNDILGTATQGWVDFQFEYTNSKSAYDIALINICDSSALTDVIDVTLSGLMLFDVTNEAISIQNTTIQIGSTVYGGEYDARTGVLTVDTIYKRITTVNNITNSKIAMLILTTPEQAYSYDISTNNLLCNILKPSNYSSATDNHVHFTNTTIMSFHFADDIGTTKAEWETYLSNNPLYVSYKLIESQWSTIQLTPIQLETLLAENNIWADTGDTTLQYPKFG